MGLAARQLRGAASRVGRAVGCSLPGSQTGVLLATPSVPLDECGFGPRQVDAAVLATHHGFRWAFALRFVERALGHPAAFLVSGQHAGDHEHSDDEYYPEQYFSHISPVPE